MILRPRPGIFRLFVIMRGSIVPKIAPHILAFAAWGALVVTLDHRFRLGTERLGVAPFAILGVTLSIYLGFRNNAAYERWWEARKLWGQLVYEVRSLARATISATSTEQARPMLMETLAFCHLLRGSLRGVDATSAAAALLTDDSSFDAGSINAQDAAVRAMGARLARWRRDSLVEPVDVRIIDEHLSAVAAVAAGCERIATTPVPFAYTLLLHRSTYVFCALLPFGLVPVAGWWSALFTAVIAYSYFGLDALSEELEDPFGLAPNDLALDALCRVCEISVYDALGEPAPEPLQPVGYVLT